jgi:cell division septum initiation protein DivIVA
MNDNSDLLPNLVHEDAFEMQMRGYSRRQVDEYIARCRSQIRDLEQRLARALDDGEEMRNDLATARQQALGAKPAHEEVSERIAQILKLADDEARSQKSKAHEDIARQRNDAQADADKARAEAREQAERMLTAAQEQAERAITSARSEAEKTLTAARAEAERTTSDAKKKSDSALAGAKAQAKKALDEATARATAIHDGAERRLNLLSNRHTETIKRLTEILDGVSTLVAAETARMSLEDEVEQATAKAIGSPESAAAPGPATGEAGSNGPTGRDTARPATSLPPKLVAAAAAQPGSAQTYPGHPAPTRAAPAHPGLSQPTSAQSIQATSPQPIQSGSQSGQSAQSQSGQSQSGQSQSGQSQSGQSQDRRSQSRAAILESDDETENIRIRPDSDS